MNELSDYIERRIRRPIPDDTFIVPGSTPVVSFGNSRTAVYATLGLNPSRVEFLDRSGRLLTGADRRLSTYQSLGSDSLSDAPSDIISQVLQDCDNYFKLNPYRQWFDPLNAILKQSGASYYDGTACHLDLVQWATDPTWGSLKPKTVRERLLNDDAEFLHEQLSQENISTLLINGSSVLNQLRRSLGVAFTEQEPISGYGRHDTRLFTATINNSVSVIAWSTNLQSSFGVSTALKIELAQRVSLL